MAKNTNPPPRRPASPEAPTRSVGPLRGRAGGRGLPLAAFVDVVDEWKRDALMSVGAVQRRRPKFRLRIEPGFILVAMAAGTPFGVVSWAVALVTLLSVLLVQEMPSVLAARAAQRGVCVVLSAGGSHAEVDGPAFGKLKFAGLAACGALCNLGVAIALRQLLRNGVVGGGAAAALAAAAVVHGFWGLAQLLPVPPFRAGLGVARGLRPPMRFAFTAVCFVATGVATFWVLRTAGLHLYFSAFVLTLVASTSALRDAFNDLMDDQSGVAIMTAQAAKLLGQDQSAQAVEMARRALASATVESNRIPLCRTLAWAAIAGRDPFTAHGALLRLPPEARDLHLIAAYLACCGRVGEAIALLQQARAHGHRARETSKLLIDLLFQAGQLAEANIVVHADRTLLGSDNMSALEAAFGERLAPA